MGARKTAGATAPATIEDLHIDQEAASSWRAFKYLRVLNDEEADNLAKMDAAIAYAGLVAGIDEAAIVDLAGGEDAQIAAVMETVAAIIAQASPKN